MSFGKEGLSGEANSGGEGNDLSVRREDQNPREAELLTRLKYLQADFENYRKRTEKEMRGWEEKSSKELVLRLLNILDELDLAVMHMKEGVEPKDLQEGIEMIQKNLLSALESAGLRKIEPVGQPFDPSRHEAVEKIQGSPGRVDIVVKELRTGYLFRGQVLRPSMVKVELATKEPSDGGKEDE